MTAGTDSPALGYRPGLDGVRGLAILLVIAAHAGVPGMAFAGQVGVTMFFTLSGFLITALLASERAAAGRISLLGFYRRRALRLLPALALVLLVVGAATRDWAAPAWALSYVGNWARIGGADLGPLNHTWSLAIEEQFYLLWPVAFIVLAARRHLVAGLLLTATASALLRIAIGDEARVFLGTDTRADALLVGCALALLPWGRVPATAAVAAVGGLLVLGMVQSYAALVVVAPLTAVLILYALRRPGPLGWAPLRWMGRVSYGLYLWHFPLLLVMPPLLAVPTSFVVAAASYYGMERWFLRLKGHQPASSTNPSKVTIRLTVAP